MGVERAGGSLSEEPLAFAFDREGNEISRRGFGPRVCPGQFFNPILSQRPAVGSDWAFATSRGFRRANQSAEFHQGLVQRRTRATNDEWDLACWIEPAGRCL